MIPIVSIIVPIYNKENHLYKCIESLQNQTLKEIQIILVNDGSSDDSLAISRKLAVKDNRITVIDQPNGGVSVARNSGLAIAQGEYIGFVDPDDWVESDMYESMYHMISETASDICLCNISEDYDDKQLIFPVDVSGIVEEDSIVEDIVSKVISSPELSRGKGNIMGSSCRLLLKRELLSEHDIRFPEGIPLMEDTIFCVESFLKAKRICINDQSFYHYNKYSSSATNAYLKDNFSLQQKFYACLEKVVIREGQESNLAEEMKIRYISMAMSAISNELNPNNTNSKREKRHNILRICADEKVEAILKDFNMEGFNFRKKTILLAIKFKKVTYLYGYYTLLKKLIK